MGAGRPAKPTALKLLQGNPGKRAINRNEPQAKRGKPAMPKGLDARGRKAWEEMAQLLDDMGVLTVADGMALETLVDAYSEWKKARAVVKKEGQSYKSVGENGGFMLRARPEVAIASDAWRRIKSLLGEFGLTPSSRTKLQAQHGDDEDPFESWLNGGGGKAKGPGKGKKA